MSLKSSPRLGIQRKVILALGAFSVGMSQSYAGGQGVGNGGVAYVCRNSAGEISSARLLDLWEAEGLEYSARAFTTEEWVDYAVSRLGHDSRARVLLRRELNQQRLKIVKTNRTMVLTEDAFPRFEPENGCKFEQVARMEFDTSSAREVVRIQAPLFGQLDALNQAALYLHEAIYALDRRINRATDSVATRAVVAHLLSTGPMEGHVLSLVSRTMSDPGVLVMPRGKRGDVRLSFEHPEEYTNKLQIQARRVDAGGTVTSKELRISQNRYARLSVEKLFPGFAAGELYLRVKFERASLDDTVFVWLYSGKEAVVRTQMTFDAKYFDEGYQNILVLFE